MFFGIDFHPLIVRHGYAVVFIVVLLEGPGRRCRVRRRLCWPPSMPELQDGSISRRFCSSPLPAAFLAGRAAIGSAAASAPEFLRKYGKWIGLTENRLALGRHLFQSHGGKIVFFGRFVAVLRIVAALLAGLNRYDFRRFFLFNAAGVVAWAAIMGLGGYFFGDAMTRVSGPLGAIGLGFAAAVVVGFLLFCAGRRKNSSRNSPKTFSRKTAKRNWRRPSIPEQSRLCWNSHASKAFAPKGDADDAYEKNASVFAIRCGFADCGSADGRGFRTDPGLRRETEHNDSGQAASRPRRSASCGRHEADA